MKEKLKDFLANVWDEITYNVKDLCGQPSPMKRLIIVLVIGGALSIASIYTLVSSIYSVGKQDAEKEFLELQHIKSLELQKRNDSIQSVTNYKLKIKNKDDECEQQSDDR